MRNTKHTTGPWTAGFQIGGHHCVMSTNGQVVAATGKIGDRYDAQSLADSNLIAAAPELLAALSRMLSEHDCITIGNGGKPGVTDRWPDAAKAARAAIAKAMGE